MKRIEELDALKGIALIGIFLLHIKCAVEWATFGVCVFFVLSGYLLEIRYLDNEQILLGGVRANLLFAIKHMRKVYPLHLITMLAVLALKVYQSGITMGMLRNMVLNIFLLQSWYPDTSVNVSLNGVAWYLSTALFLYFMFPCIHKWLKRKEKCGILVLSGGGILAAQILVSLAALIINPEDRFYRWITYDAPFFRLGDFAIGCFLGRIMSGKMILSISTKSMEKFTANVLSVILLAVTVGFVAWDTHVVHVSIPERILNNWTTVYIPIVCGWVFLFATGQGLLPKLLVNRVTVWIGENSMYLFLIHYVIIMYVREFTGNTGEGSRSLLFVGVTVIVTVLCTLVYKKAENVVRHTRQKKT